MNYNEEQFSNQNVTAEEKAAIEELQKEQLRLIWEAEQQKNQYIGEQITPDMDSAFAPSYEQQKPQITPDMDSAFAVPYMQQQPNTVMPRQTVQQGVQPPPNTVMPQQRPVQQMTPQQPQQQRRVAQQRPQQPQQRPQQPQQQRRVAQQRPQQQSQQRPVQQKTQQQQGRAVQQRKNDNMKNDNYNRQNADYEQQAQKPRKKKKRRHPIRKLLITLLILVAAFGGLGIAMINSVFNKLEHIDTEVSKRPGAMQGEIVNILLVGQDARSGQGAQRSDSMILCSINKKTKKISLISIMRDTYVQIPGYGGNKINAAFAYGGYDLLDQTIEENFGVTIDANLEVDFEGFLAGMTAVGSLEIELTAEEAAYMNENSGLGIPSDDPNAVVEAWSLTEGKQLLTPSQLLCYSRMRYVGNSDWDRTDRQRKVISAAISKVKHGHLFSGFKMVNGAAASIATDMSKSGLYKIILPVVLNTGINSYQIPAEGTYIGDYVDGMACLIPDIQANRDLLQEYINAR